MPNCFPSLILTVVLLGSHGATLGLAASPLTLTATPNTAQYRPDERIALRLTLHLDAAASNAVTVCTFADGVVGIDSLTANGTRVTPRRTSSLPYSSRAMAQLNSLVTLQPGGSVDIPYALFRRGDRSFELRDVRVNGRPGSDRVRLYTLTIPGTYTFQLVYHYTGTDGGHTDLFRQAVTSNTVTIQLVQ